MSLESAIFSLDNTKISPTAVGLRRLVQLPRSLVAIDVSPSVDASRRHLAESKSSHVNRNCRPASSNSILPRSVCPSKSAFFVGLVMFFVILPTLCVTLGLRHSFYYQLYAMLIHQPFLNTAAAEDGRLLGDLIVENDRRIAAAKKYLEERLDSLHHTASVDGSSLGRERKTAPDHASRQHVSTIAVTIISTARDTFVSGNHANDGFRFAPNFLVQNTARFLKLIDEDERSERFEYQLSVCSVGDQLTPEEAYLARLVSVFRTRLNEKNGGQDRFGPWHDRLAWRFEKEKLDYVFCIRETISRFESSGPLYVLLVEDDSLPKAEALSVIERLVGGHWSSRTDNSEAMTSKLSYVKLFHPARLHGYVSPRPDSLLHLISVALLFGTLAHAAWPRRLHPHRPSWLGSCLFSALLALAIGRVHLDRSWRGYLAPYAHQLVADGFCCTQALLYSRRTADDVANYLDRVRCNETFHKDDALWSFGRSTSVEEEGISGLVQPNLFEHVGFYSGLRGGFVDPHVFDWD